jgi:hypothetical protein
MGVNLLIRGKCGKTDLCVCGESFKEGLSDRGDMVVRTETGVDTPGVPVLAHQLCVEVRIHLDQQSSPATLLLQVDSVGRPLSVQCTTLDKEPSTLDSLTTLYSLTMQFAIYN